ncbi:MAG: hypothetical protein HOG49_06465 [Candidatus Scalindua sp.]|jgi:hypothetical protein|nr:hypothetical protein [Candidatus Scalindua sp.]
MKIWKSVKWLFTNAPTDFTTSIPNSKDKCDYCGKNDYLIIHNDISTICKYCLKEVYDATLAYKKERLNGK